MRILFAGTVVFVIWGFFSTWLFVDILRPALKKPVTKIEAPKTVNNAADSLAKIYALMPKDLVVWYDFDKAGLKPNPELETDLAGFKNWLDKHPESMILITGYTDLVGTPEYNTELGLKRA